MRKKDIKKLNNAMLDGVEVPESVLDAARQEMLNNKPENVSSPAPLQNPQAGSKQNGGAIAVNKKLIAVCCAFVCVVCLVIIFAIMFTRPSYNTSDMIISYNIDELDVREITSLTQYNEENSTAFLGVTFENAVTHAYCDDEEIVLFEQAFTYEDVEYSWYIAVDEFAEFDILRNYIDTESTVEMGNYTISYGTAEINYAKFYSGGSAYYLTGGAEGTAIIDILKLILE